MEVDKLDDAQNSFQEDCDKFQKYMAEMEFKANRAKEDTDIVTAKKLEKARRIVALQQRLHEVKRRIAKTDDQLDECKANQQFVSMVAQSVHHDQTKAPATDDKQVKESFFVTETGQASGQQPTKVEGPSIGKHELLRLLEVLKEDNISLVGHIQDQEQEADDLRQQAKAQVELWTGRIASVKTNHDALVARTDELMSIRQQTLDRT